MDDEIAWLALIRAESATGGRSGFVSVASVAALAALPDATLPDSALASVTGWPTKPYWKLDRSSAQPVDNVTIVPTQSGNGQWVRQAQIVSVSGGVPVAQQQPTWNFDFAQTQGGNDQNDGILGPLATAAEFFRRIGTNSPRLRQVTAINFLTSQAGGSDPFNFAPYIENQTPCTLKGALTQVATGSLSNFTAKGRSGNQALQANLPSGAAAGLLVHNSTRGSRCLINSSLGGSLWRLSQPFPVWPPVADFDQPPEDDTWSSGDSVTIYSMAAVNIAQLGPTTSEYNASTGFGNLVVQNVTGLSPDSAGGLNQLVIGGGGTIYMAECSMQRIVAYLAGNQNIFSSLMNCDFASGVYNPTVGNLEIIGGQFRGFVCLGNLFLDGDVIIRNASLFAENSSYGCVYLTGSLFVDGGGTLDGTVGLSEPGGAPCLYGSGTLKVQGTSRVSYPSGAGKAVATFPLTGGIQLNGQTGCVFVTPGGGVTATGKTVTAAHLDADLGATIGAYVNLGGASITNGLP